MEIHVQIRRVLMLSTKAGLPTIHRKPSQITMVVVAHALR
jgi:hypothetical protein